MAAHSIRVRSLNRPGAGRWPFRRPRIASAPYSMPRRPAMKYKFLIAAGIAVTLAACASSAPRDRGYGYDDYGYARGSGYYEPARCHDCGQAERIRTAYGARQNSGERAMLGGGIGAVAARERPTHGSRGKESTAGVAGAVAGAAMGNAIETKATEASYGRHVRLDDGRPLVVSRNCLGDGVR